MVFRSLIIYNCYGMISYFNLDELEPVIRDFNLITKIRITVFDADFKEVTSCQNQKAPVCAFLRKDREFDDQCIICDKSHMIQALKTDNPYIYTCHCGLTEIIAPLRIEGKAVGYLFFSHILNYSSSEEAFSYIRKIARKYKSYDEKAVLKYVESMPLFDSEYLKAASRLLQETASYLIQNRVAYFQNEDLSFKVDRYISTHLNEDLSSKRLCRLFGIGKTYLYEITSELYSEPVATHIRKLRIKQAQDLLENETNMKISAIALQVGFNDYSSFISAFKKETGMTPKKFNSVTQSKRHS